MSPKAKLELNYEETAFTVVLRKNSLRTKCREKIRNGADEQPGRERRRDRHCSLSPQRGEGRGEGWEYRTRNQ
jgi:hypothetical protein